MAGLIAGALLVPAASAWATDVDPIFIAGNPSCTSLGYAFGFKVDPPNAGTYSIDGINTVTVTTDGVFFDWSSTLGMDAVISKGGPNSNVFIYDPPAESTSDTELVSPINPNNGKPYGLSHIEFCFDYEVVVSKDAHTSFTRTWEWRIDKSVSPAQWQLFNGDQGTSRYTVAVERIGHADSGWAVAGTIHIQNPAPVTATIQSVADVISANIPAAVDCGVSFPYALAGGQTLDCSYQTPLPDGTNRTNTATVATTGPVGGGSGNAAVVFGDPTTQVNASIHVSDTNGGAWQFGDSGSVSYDRTFACGGDAGGHGNTAAIVETGQSASASVSVQCYDISVTKDAHTTFDRTWKWTIDKSADQQEVTLSPGQQFPVNYTISLGAVSADDNWAAHGTIHVYNPNPTLSALINGVADVVGSITAGVTCGVPFPYLLAPGGDLSCTYTVALPSAATRTNTATATRQAFSYSPTGVATPNGTTSASGNATVDFAGATIHSFDKCVDVNDSLQGPLGQVCVADLPKTLTYSRFVGPFTSPGQCGDQHVNNTASFVAGDTGATGQDSWDVLVHVVCNTGCTLTPGYWKNHSRRGPAPYDDTWALLGAGQENTAFFLSGKTYYQVLWTAPQGNAYYILAHAWIATTLNGLNGASMPAEVMQGWQEATTLFQAWTPAQIGAQKGTQQPRKRFLELAGLLDMYNNGLLGPGHCSE
ncbi:MAG TPA: hypothetical protein VH394_06055 [Thermoanaerobaculia bacterium]|jgi:hypothetical protein|nr:hypothetical protein [Thermoanaerobaculia bacterium]